MIFAPLYRRMVPARSAAPQARRPDRCRPGLELLETRDLLAGLIISPQSVLQTTEDGGRATFSVQLAAPPSGDVVISVASSNPGQGVVSPTSLVFHKSTWNRPKPVTVRGVDDHVVHGDVRYSIHVFGRDDRPLAWGAYPGLTTAFRAKVFAMAARFGINPDYLMAVMAFESSFSPSIKNPRQPNPGQKYAVGLIQFRGDAATDLHVTQAALGAMTAVRQLDYVEQYYALAIKRADRHGLKLRTLSDVYMAVFQPAMVGMPENTIIFPKDSQKALGNKALWDKDHNIVKATATRVITAKLVKGRLPGNVGYLNEVPVINRERDKAGVVVTPATGLVTTSAGGQARFTVRLTSIPAAKVTIGLHSSDPQEAKLSTALLTFDRNNWAGQTVVVTGGPGKASLRDVPFRIATDRAVSADRNYQGKDVADVTGVNRHNLLSGVWTGGYDETTVGDGGLSYHSHGTLRLSFSLNANGTFSGSAFKDGIELKIIETGGHLGYTSSNGSATATLQATHVEGTMSFPIAETGATQLRTWTATVVKNTLSGILKKGGVQVGRFTLTKTG